MTCFNKNYNKLIWTLQNSRAKLLIKRQMLIKARTKVAESEKSLISSEIQSIERKEVLGVNSWSFGGKRVRNKWANAAWNIKFPAKFPAKI